MQCHALEFMPVYAADSGFDGTSQAADAQSSTLISTMPREGAWQ
jgi:hypothetical protein